MKIPRNRKHVRRLVGFILALSVVTNCLSLASYSLASVSLAKQPVVKRSKHVNKPLPDSISHKTATSGSEDVKKQISETYGKLPLSFEANTGLADPRFKFFSRGNGYSVFLSPQETVLFLSKTPARARLKNNLRYVLSHHPDFAIWKREGETLATFRCRNSKLNVGNQGRASGS